MLTFIWRTLRDRKIFIIVFCLATVALLEMYVALYPAIQEQAGKFDELMEAYPEALMKAFNLEELSFDTLEKFLAMEQFSILWPIMAIILVISLAGNGLAGEVDRGTVELLLSRPVSRWRLFFARYLTGLIVLAIFTVLSVFAAIPLAELHGLSYATGNYITTAVIAFLFGWAVFSLAMMFSAMFSERSRVYMLAGGLLVAMYALNIIASLKESLENLQYASFFHYFDANKALIKNEWDVTAVIVFAVVVVVCTTVGAWWFKKRDIAV